MTKHQATRVRATSLAHLAAGLFLFALGAVAPAWAAVNLGTSTFTGPANYEPGQPATAQYVLTLVNTGSDATAAIPVAVSFPASSTTAGSWTCSAAGSGSNCGTGALTAASFARTGVVVGAAGSVTFTSTGVAFALTAGSPGNDLVVSATATGMTNKSVSSNRIPVYNLSTSTFTGPGVYRPGAAATANYVLTVKNTGPDPISGRTVAVNFPATDDATGTWACVASSGGNCGVGLLSNESFSQTGVTIAANGTVTYTSTNIAYLLTAGSPGNALTVTSAVTGTPAAGNPNNPSVTSTREPVSNVAVAMASTPTTFTPGATGAFTATLTNTGPDPSSGVTFNYTAPSGVTVTSWTCVGAGGTSCSAGGSGNLAVTGINMALNGTATFTVNVAYDSSLLAASLVHTASVVVPAASHDRFTTDDSASVTLAIARQAAVRVSKQVRTSPTGPLESDATVSPGAYFTYEIKVENLGPSDVGAGAAEEGITLTDTFSGSLAGDPAQCAPTTTPCWTYCPGSSTADGDYTAANCQTSTTQPPATGSGSFGGRSIKLTAGSSSTMLVYAAVGPGVSGAVTNTATVGLSGVALAGTAATRTSTATVNVTMGTDVSVITDDGKLTAIPGNDHEYTVTVRNAGFVAVNNVAVAGLLPLFQGATTAGFTAGTSSWQCSATGGACCNTNSSVCGISAPTTPVAADGIDAHVDLPSQGQVTFKLRGRIDPRATGTLDYSVASTLPAGITDINAANNADADADTVLVPQAGLQITKSLLALTGDAAPYTLDYRITASNSGPSFVAATVSDLLDDEQLDAATATWTCSETLAPAGTACPPPASGSGALAAAVQLPPGAELRFDVSVHTDAVVSGEPIVNTAVLDWNGVTKEATVSSGLSGEADLAIVKTDNRTSATPGGSTQYTLTVTNAGPDDVFGARVQDTFPAQLDNVSWTCKATTPVPGNLEFKAVSGSSGTPALAVVTSADSRHAYEVGTTNDGLFRLYAFSRNQVPGLGFGDVALLETETDGLNDPSDSGAAVSGMRNPVDLVMSPDGAMLFVLSDASALPAGTSSSIVAFNRVTNPADPNFGKLSFAGAVNAGLPASPKRIVMTQTQFYVSGASQVSIYKRDSVSGLPLFDIAHTSGVPASPGPMAISLADSTLFVASSGSAGVARFAINTTAGATPLGRLALVASVGSGDADFGGITDIAAAPDAKDLYVAAGTLGRIVVLRWETGLVKTIAYGSSGSDASALTGETRLNVAPDGEHVLGVNRAGSVFFSSRRNVFSGLLGGVGNSVFEERFSLTSGPGNQTSNPQLASASDLVVTSDGRHVLIASAASSAPARQLAVYLRRAPDPTFAFVENDRQGDAYAGDNGQPLNIAGLLSPTDTAVSKLGDHVYAVSLQDGALTVFRRFPGNGFTADTAGEHLEFVTAYRDGDANTGGLARANRILLGPDDRSVYVSSEDNNTVAWYEREDDANDANFGKLTFRQVWKDGVGGIDGLLGAQGMAISADGRSLYVAGSFEAAIAVFRRDPATLALTYDSVVKGGVNGVSGMAGIRDLQVLDGGAQVLGVSATSNAVVVFNRTSDTANPNFGKLAFLQAFVLGGNERPMSLALPPADLEGNVGHVYVAAQNSNRIHVLARVTDPTSVAYGTVRPAFQYASGTAGFSKLVGPRDITVSPNGKRVYVAAQFSHSLLVLDRDLNKSSARYGGLNPVEVRTDENEGVNGINALYAVAVSPDSRNVYAAGFGDGAIASFAVGTGSSCSVGGSGDIDDIVDIGVGGTLQYTATASILPGAVGSLSNTATVTPPERIDDPNAGNNTSTDTNTLQVAGDLSISKTNDQVSVVGGQTVTYAIDVRNAGPSNVVNGPSSPVNITDLFNASGGAGCASGFEPATAVWTCVASGSGALDYIDTRFGGDIGTGPLGGVSGLALVPDADGAGPLTNYLAAASVLDNSVTLFTRDPIDGTLDQALQIRHGTPLNGSGAIVDSLEGARSVLASRDGKFLYVASRVSDAVTVYQLGVVSGALRATLVDVKRNLVGLDQALHLALSPDADEASLYAAGANDDAITVFSRNKTTGVLTYVESEQNGVNDPTDVGNTVAGLSDVEFTVVSPDGAHLYALSGTGASVATFNRDAATGKLSFRSVATGVDLNVALDGVSSAVFDTDGEYLYLTVANANRVVVLHRAGNADATFGNLTLSSSVAQDVGGTLGLLTPRRAVLTADDRHLYVTGQSGGSVAWFARDPNDGSLRYLGQRSNESSEVDGLAGATGVVIDNTLNQIYVAGTLQAAVVQFRRQVDSFCPPSGSGPLAQVPVNIAAGGTLSFAVTVQVRSDLQCPLRNDASVTSSSDPNAANNAASDIDVISSVADLSITKDDGLAEFDGLSGAVSMAGDNRGLFVAAPTDNAIGVYTRQFDAGQPNFGTVRFAHVVRSGQDGVAGLSGVADVLLSGDGKHVYAVGPVDNAIATFARDANTNALDYIDIDQNGVLGVTGMSGARAVAESADGVHLYVASEFSNAVAMFARDNVPASPTFGTLTYRSVVQNAVGGVDGLLAPIDVAVAPDGKQVYALGTGADSIAVFARNPNAGSGGFGQLSFTTRLQNNAGGVTGMAGVRALLIDATGAHVYVLAATDGNLVHFTRDTGSGVLTYAQAVSGTGLVGATHLRFAGDGASVYVAGASSDAIARFTLAAGVPTFAGAITQGDDAPLTGGQVLGLDGVADVFASPDGEQVYAVSGLDNALATFERDPAAAPDTTDLQFADVIFDGLGGVAPGDAVTYAIRVENHGPSDVATARVLDPFPAQFASVQWSCSGGGGGACVPSGNGNIDTVVQLPVGGSVVFLATGVVSSTAGGRLSNTATVAANGVTDPLPANNSATDGNTVLSPAMDLVTTVSDGATASIPGDRVDYDVRLTNLGPTYATAVTVHDTIPPALYDVAWTCSPVPVPGVLSLFEAEIDSAGASTTNAFAFDPLGNFVYTTGLRNGIGSVVVWQRDPLNGGLTERKIYSDGDVIPPVGNGVAVTVRGIGGAADLVLSGDGRFLYVAGRSSDSIALFARAADTGELTFIAQYQDGELGIDGLGGVTALARSADGRHLYAAGGLDDAIVTFGINAGTGALTSLGIVRQGGAIDGLNGVTDIALSADGTHVFATAADNQSLAVFTRNQNSGLLTFTDVAQDFELPTHALLNPTSLLVANGQVYVASTGGDQIGVFRFADNVLTLGSAIVNGVGGTTGLVQPRALAFDPDQKRLYAVASSGRLLLFSLLGAAPEQLASYAASGFPVLTGAAAIGLSTDEHQLYTGADNVAGGIGVWTRERGSRCPVAGSGALNGVQVDIAPGGYVAFEIGGDIFANALGNLSYQVSADNRVPEEELNAANNVALDLNTLQPNPDMSVSKTDNRSTVVAGLPTSYTVNVSNAGLSDAIAAQLSDTVPVFPIVNAGLVAGDNSWTCAANVPLGFLDERAAVSLPDLLGVTELALAPDATQLFATVPTQNALLAFPLDAAGVLGTAVKIVDGGMLGSTAVSGLRGASYVASSHDGKYVFVTGATDNSLVVLGRDAVAGTFSFVQKLVSGTNNVAGLTAPSQVVVSADDTFVYVASPGADSIAVFRRDALTGLLTFVERARDGFGSIQPESNVIRGVRRLHLSGDGSQLYAVAPTSNAITTFDIDASSGKLTFRQVIRSTAVAALAATRDVVAAPGDTYLYALGSASIAMFSRDADGRLVHVTSFAHQAAAPTALRLDAHGSRVYVTDSTGAVHVFARDWSTGALDHRFRMAASDAGTAMTAPGSLLFVPSLADLFVASPGATGGIVHLDERALSRCLTLGADTDAMSPVIDLGATGSAALEYTGTVHPSARGTLTNTASIMPTSGADPDPANDSATDTSTILVQSDVGISKTGPADGVAGEAIEYTIHVTNAGPSDALGLRVVDDLHASILAATWTCSASGASSCPASGSGDLDVAANLLVGDTLDFVVSATISPAFLGSLPNTATLVPEVGATDPTTDDHSASVTTTVIAIADVGVTKTNGSATTVAGTPTTYTIDIVNAGPSDSPHNQIVDPTAAGLVGATWTCAPSGGATCPATGSGSIDFDAALPAGSGLHIVATGLLAASAQGELVNRVDVTVQAPTNEPDLTNNTATDTDTVLVHPEIAIELEDPLDPFDPAGAIDLPYLARITNNGPSDARDVTLDLAYSTQITQTIPGLCTVQSGYTQRCNLGTLTAGQVVEIRLAYRNLPSAPSTLTINGTVATSGDDQILPNNSTVQTTLMQTGGDVMVSIDDGQHAVRPGTLLTYRVEVYNIGSLAADDVVVSMPNAPELLNVTWTCSSNSGTACVNGSGNLSDTLDLGPSSKVIYTVKGTVDPTLDPLVPRQLVQTVTATTLPGGDINLGNNSATDIDIVQYLIFSDGFEVLVNNKFWLPKMLFDGTAGACPRRAGNDDAMLDCGVLGGGGR